jgi:C_GCAxxG_C_C family probable redox protein
MKRSDCSVQCFLNGFNCAQAVFSTYCNELGLEPETALRVAGGFGGGMGHIGETCGAVTGAFMLIGLKHGKVKAEDNAAKEKTYALVQEFAKRFKAVNGSVQCKELLGCDISLSEGMQNAKDKLLFTTICPKLVKDSCEIVEELLELKEYEETLNEIK